MALIQRKEIRIDVPIVDQTAQYNIHSSPEKAATVLVGDQRLNYSHRVLALIRICNGLVTAFREYRICLGKIGYAAANRLCCAKTDVHASAALFPLYLKVLEEKAPMLDGFLNWMRRQRN